MRGGSKNLLLLNQTPTSTQTHTQGEKRKVDKYHKPHSRPSQLWRDPPISPSQEGGEREGETERKRAKEEEI